MTDAPTTELDRIVGALAAGDPAFVATLVLRYGAPVARAARARGVPDDDVAGVIHDVAFALLGRTSGPGVAAWDVVLGALDAVVGATPPSPEPPAGPGPRSLHLIDIENLAGGPDRIDRWFRRSIDQYCSAAGPQVDDHVVVAADASVWVRTAWDVDRAWDYRFGRGPDGADQALLERADPDWVAGRFDRLVVGSGDHAFAPLVAEVRNRGVDAVVVARPRQLAAALRRTGATVVALPDLPAAPDGSVTRLTLAA